MSRAPAPDLLLPWKLSMPATLAGKVEYKLLDPIHSKPKYGARQQLVTALLEYWLAVEEGRDPPRIPTSQELMAN